MSGTTFLGDVLQEYIRITYFKDGSDYVREFLKEKRGHGWNDPDQEVHVTERDLEKIRAFMEPIRKRFREADLAREQELERRREILRGGRKKSSPCPKVMSSVRPLNRV